MGSKSGPPAPDYGAAAQSRPRPARNTAQQTWANRPDQNTPWGSTKWSTRRRSTRHGSGRHAVDAESDARSEAAGRTRSAVGPAEPALRHGRLFMGRVQDEMATTRSTGMRSTRTRRWVRPYDPSRYVTATTGRADRRASNRSSTRPRRSRRPSGQRTAQCHGAGHQRARADHADRQCRRISSMSGSASRSSCSAHAARA